MDSNDVNFFEAQQSRYPKRLMIRIIHINSFGHSGSTLVNLLVAENAGIFAGGHLFRYSYLWKRDHEVTTADGKLLKDSDFWKAIKAKVEKDTGKKPDFSQGPNQFDKQDVQALFKAITEESGCEIICDNSKSRAFDKIIYNPPFDTYMVHLVRDGRAVYNSYRKKGIVWPLMPIRWTVSSIHIWLKNKTKTSYNLVRYEDVALHLEKTSSTILDNVLKYFKIQKTDINKRTENTVPLMFAGNRTRTSYTTGAVSYDNSYLKDIPPLMWLYLTLTMLPALLIFGYPLTRKGVQRKFCKTS